MALGPIQFICFGVRTEEQKSAVLQALRAHSERGAINILEAGYLQRQEDGTAELGQRLNLSEAEGGRHSAVDGASIGRDPVAYAWGKVRDLGGGGAGPQVGSAPSNRSFGESLQQAWEQIADTAQELSPGSTLYMALIEHRWAPPLKDTLQTLKDILQPTGVLVLAERMVRPSPLLVLGSGLAAAEQAVLQ